MGGGEAATPSKVTPKAPSSAQEQAPATTSSPTATAAPAAAVIYPDWTGFQAYSAVPPHGFFPPVVSSPQTHPYVWGAQNIVTPYGTPAAPFVMYPHGGMYVHPSIPPGSHPFSPYMMPSLNGNPEASGAATDVDGKSSEGKEGSNLKQSNGSLGSLNMLTGKSGNEMGKTSGVSANETFSQSGESGSEGSSEGSDANSQNESQSKKAGGQDSLQARASQNDSSACSSQNGIANTPPQGTVTQPMPALPMAPAAAPGGFVGPMTNLNIGMDYWGGPARPQMAPVCGKVHNPPVGGVLVSSGQNISSEIWLQGGDRELKRERRKQSNRESARRSRLRKQAECEELAQRVETLKDENTVLRTEISRVRKEYELLLSENNSLKERIGEAPKGNENSKVDKNKQHSTRGDRDGHSDAQAAQTDLSHGGR